MELESKNFSYWYLRNIKKNKFAVENKDYIVFVIENENPKTGGRTTTDYKLTYDFAKQLSMTVKNECGQETRKYFITCEQELKVAV